MRKINETGNRHGRLVVVGEAGRANGDVLWRALCDCGQETVARGYNLRKEITRSCGCLRERSARTHGHTAGGSWSPTYQTWQAMKQRCFYPKTISYPYYGARGITIDPRWLDFENFLADVGERPEGMTLDRIDPNGDYEPGNVRWATALEQRHNRSD